MLVRGGEIVRMAGGSLLVDGAQIAPLAGGHRSLMVGKSLACQGHHCSLKGAFPWMHPGRPSELSAHRPRRKSQEIKYSQEDKVIPRGHTMIHMIN